MDGATQALVIVCCGAILMTVPLWYAEKTSLDLEDGSSDGAGLYRGDSTGRASGTGPTSAIKLGGEAG